MAGDDKLLIHSDAEARTREYILDWTFEEWPPPPVIGCLTHSSAPGQAVALLTAPEGEEALEKTCQREFGDGLREHYGLKYYRRSAYSKLPAEHGPHLLRGATYVPTEGWDES